MANYIKIEQWMIDDLHLSGNELVLFALVRKITEKNKAFI